MDKSFGFIILVFLLVSCSTKKDTFVNRNYHRITSEFNTLFNGRENLEKGLLESENNHEIDFTSLLKLERVIDTSKTEKQTKAPSLFQNTSSGVPDKEEQKAQGPIGIGAEKAIKAIESHSMEIKNREINKKIDDAYMLLGKSRYYDGKPFQALEAFNYIITYLSDHDQITNARIWAARSVKLAGNTFSSIDALKTLLERSNSLENNHLIEIHHLLADIYIGSQKYSVAIQELNLANRYVKKKINRIRNNYLIAQLQKLSGQILESSRSFNKVLKLNPPIDYQVFATLGIASNFVSEKHDKDAFIKELEELAKRKKYFFYRGEILYQLGSVEFKSGNDDLARSYFDRVIKSQVKYERTKGLAYAKLGDIKLKENEFLSAYKYYDSAVVSLPESFELNKDFKAKKEKLQKFAELHKVKVEADSVLRMSALNTKERTAIFDKHIEALKKEEKENQQKAFKATQVVNIRANNQFESSIDRGKWYFYTNYAKDRGLNEFRKKWGNRKLRDRWRWNKSNVRTNRSKNRDLDASGSQKQNEERFSVDFYLNQIPDDQESISKLKNLRDESSLELGKIYFDGFNNKEKATAEFKELIANKPIKKVEAEANYYLYKLTKDLNPEQAERFKNHALQEEIVFEIEEENILNLTPSTKEALSFYMQTYQMYINGKYALVQINAAQAVKRYGKQKIAPKFELLSAMSLARQRNSTEYIVALEKLTAKYLGYPESKKARELIQTAQRLIKGKK